MTDDDGIGLIGELASLQRAQNEWWQNATPEERRAANRADMRYINENLRVEIASVLATPGMTNAEAVLRISAILVRHA